MCAVGSRAFANSTQITSGLAQGHWMSGLTRCSAYCSRSSSGTPGRGFDAQPVAPRPVARYIGRHGTKRVAKAVLIGAVPPLLLKTAANPGGLPMEAFDQIRAGVLADRSQ